jgi:hypothetical protein
MAISAPPIAPIALVVFFTEYLPLLICWATTGVCNATSSCAIFDRKRDNISFKLNRDLFSIAVSPLRNIGLTFV